MKAPNFEVYPTESVHDQGDHFTRDISSDVPVKYDTRRYLNSLKDMIYRLTVYLKVWFALIYYSKVNNNITCEMSTLIVE